VEFHGSINHVSVTVSHLDAAMVFFRPLLEHLGYRVGDVLSHHAPTTRLVVSIHPGNGVAFNVWEATTELAAERFEVYAPGLHHVAFNAGSRAQVDAVCRLVRELGAEVLDGPREFPFADDGMGYYAVYFRGPDSLKLEVVHMPGLQAEYENEAGRRRVDRELE
jgi:glyoxylase I family protein